MKKFICSVLVLMLIFMLSGCGKGGIKFGAGIGSIKEETVVEALYDSRFYSGDFSISFGELLPECCADYEINYTAYNKAKNDYLEEDDITDLEEGDYKQYLDNSYFVTVSGMVMENPQLPNLLKKQDEIVTLLILFDKNDEAVSYQIVNCCSQLETCAILLMF